MKILVLVFYIILFSATVVDLTATAVTTTTTTTTATTTKTALPAALSSTSSTSSKTTSTQPLSTQKEAHGTSSYCRCPDGTTIALSGLTTTTGKHAESPPVLTNTTDATDGAIVNRTPTSSIKPNTTLMNTKSRTTPSSIKPSTTLTNIKPSTTSTNKNPSTTQASTNSSTTPTSINSSTTQTSTNSITKSSANSSTTPTSTKSSTTASSTNSSPTPTSTNSSTSPTNTNSSTTPTNTNSSTTPTNTNSSTTPTSTTSSTTPTSTTSSTTPTSTTSSTTPTSTTSSTTPTSTKSSTTPTSTTSSTTPTSTTSSTTPTSTTSSTTTTSIKSSTTTTSTKQSTTTTSITQNKARNPVAKATLPASKAGSRAKRVRSDNKKFQGNSILVNGTITLHHTTPATTDNTTMVTSQDTTDHGTGTEQHIYTTIVNPRCSEICQAHSAANATISAVDSTTVPKQATKPSTVMHPDIAPKWDDVQLDIPLVIVINETFPPNLEKQNSDEYRELAKKFQTKLQDFYSHTPHFEKIVIKRFSKGSIKCQYSVVLNTNNLTKTSLHDVIKYIRNNRTNEAELNTINGIGQIEVSKTMKLMTGDLSKAESKFKNLCETYGDKMCEYDRKCKIKDDQYHTPYCIYKCNTGENRCGEHGTCSVDEKGKIACKCKEDPLYVFHGERCDIKEEKLLLSKNYIIAIAAGGGGAVILLLFISMICLCRKWNKANKASQFYRNRSTKSPRDRESVAYEDDKGIQMENSRMENVYMSEHGHENNGFAVDSAAPSADGSSMRYEKGRYYRVVKDPELGSDTLIYQPSNLNRPIQRESTISKDEEPDPLRSHYDYIDTDTVYKIKRPNVRSNTIDSNGHPRTVL